MEEKKKKNLVKENRRRRGANEKVRVVTETG